MSEFVVLKVLEALDDFGQDGGFFLKTAVLLLMKSGTKNNREQPKTIGMISGGPGQSSTDRVLMIFAHPHYMYALKPRSEFSRMTTV